jgi:hypothetical protein
MKAPQTITRLWLGGIVLVLSMLAIVPRIGLVLTLLLIAGLLILPKPIGGVNGSAPSIPIYPPSISGKPD